MISERVRRLCIVLTLVAIVLCLVSCSKHNTTTPVSQNTGTYVGSLHWTVRGKVFDDQKTVIEVTQEGTSLNVRGRLVFPRDVAPLPPLVCALDGSSCRSAGVASDGTCGKYDLVSASLSFRNGSLDYSGVSDSEWCAQWHLFGVLQK